MGIQISESITVEKCLEVSKCLEKQCKNYKNGV